MNSRLLNMLCAVLICLATNLSAKEVDSLPIVPKPLSTIVTGKTISCDEDWLVYVNPHVKIDTAYLSSVLKEYEIKTHFTGRKKDAVLILDINKTLSKNQEAYRLRIDENRKIVAEAPTRNGLLFALQSLRQIMTKADRSILIPCCLITDEPAFSWRAFMLDESRHFQGMETVMRLLDEMARLKMNTFHWHLVDDPGWRIEIKHYPELTRIGSKRDFTNGGLTPEQWDNTFPGRKMYYSQEEIREIVKYADNRGIKIIPEIEVPGHASASIYAYPWLGASSRKEGKGLLGDLYDITDPKVEEFLHHVLDEVIALFPSKIIHIGGDEANYIHWKNNLQIVQFMKDHSIPTFPDLQIWSINRFSQYLDLKGVRMMGWNEITGDNVRPEADTQASQSERLAPETIVHFWDGEIGLVNKAIEKGYDVVNSNRHFTYLDYPYEVIPLDKAYSFSPIPQGLAKEKEPKILGLGCQMWGEYTPNLSRLYYQTFPRIAAYAECGWTKTEKKDYNEFCHRMKNIEYRWLKAGYIDQQPLYSAEDDGFTLWQIPSQINTIGNSYVIRTGNGKVIVMDGGVKEEEGYLRGFLAALGNIVDYWFVSHPHPDHIGALTKILEDPKDIKIHQICQSTFSDELLSREPDYKAAAVEYYEAAKKSGINIIEATPGMTFIFRNVTFKILGVKNEGLTANPYNNSSMVIKVWDPKKSVLFLADTGKESGELLLKGPYGKELDCDYLQMAHHGQAGVSKDFYRTIKFKACLWPSPTWVYNNDAGKGYNTHTFETVEIRSLMDSLGIKKHYVSNQGLCKIE